jgi:hypothetical protein
MCRLILVKFCILSAAILLILCSCSSSSTVVPQDQDSSPISLSPISETFDNPDDHLLMGTWDADFNIHDNSVIVTPNRETATHFPITSLIPPPIIHINSIAGETLDVDITIQNPYPLDVYDVRLIIYTDPIGHMLLNADDWTPLFDIAGGLPVNPFKAFMKSEPDRKFPGMTEQTVKCLITVPGNNFSIRFALEASHPGNCEEPYEIKDFSQGVLYNQIGSSSNATITVLDWQTDTNSVYLYCPDITGSDFVPFSQITQDSWELELINETGASVGSYQAFIIAFSSNSGNILLANRVMIQVNPSEIGGWARSWGGEYCDKALGVTSDSQNDILVTGYFFDSFDFDPGPGIDIHYSNGGDDIFLSKFDQNGDLIWAKTWGSSSDDRSGMVAPDDYCYLYGFDPPRGLITDINDNIYLTGSFQGTCDFDPGPGIDEHISNGGCDIYLAKFSADGNFIWARTWGGQRSDVFLESGADIALGLKQDIYVSGYFSNSVDFDPGSGEDWHTLVNEGGGASFVSKFDLDGNYKWARTWGGQKLGFDIGYGVACVKSGEGSGDILVTGTFRGVNIDFDPGTRVDLHSSVPSTSRDAYLTRFGENGDFRWAETWSNAGCDYAYDLAVDLSGCTYVVGMFAGSGDFDPGADQFILESYIDTEDSYVSKFNSAGEFMLAFSWGSVNADLSTSISLDNTGNQYIYVTTMYFHDIDLDPGPGEDIHHHNGFGGSDNALSKCDLNGNYVWGRSWGGTDNDYNKGVCVNNNGNIFVSGNHYGITDFNPGLGIDNHESIGESDAFLIKFLSNGYW